MLVNLNTYLLALDGVKTKSTNDKSAVLKNIFASDGQVVTACQALKEARDVRNRSSCSQYLNKNVGSFAAAQLPIFLDTVEKASRIRRHMADLKILPSDKDALDVYGVAYGHMSPLLKSLLPAGKVKFYDIVKAKNSTAEWEKGNVWDLCSPGGYVIDDSYCSKINTLNRDIYHWPEPGNGDHLKLSKAVLHPMKVAYMKMSIASFATNAQRTLISNLLFPSDKKHPYKTVRLFKFGKLHNEEVFLFLSNHALVAASNGMKTLNGDVIAISHAIVVANKIITLAESKGVRLGGTNDKTKAMSVKLWSALLKALPAAWTWYIKDVATKEIPMIGMPMYFNATALNAVDESEITYDDYVDGVGDVWN